MTTQLSDGTEVALTPQEAEAVIELWAKRQSETEALRARTTVNDLAEVMSIPPQEVATMLQQVRQTPPAKPVVVSGEAKLRKRNRGLLVAAVVIWFALIGCGLWFAYKAGQKSLGAEEVAPPAADGSATVETPKPPSPSFDTPTAVAGTTAPASVNTSDPANIPQGVSVSLKGYQLDGEASVSGTSEDQIKFTLFHIISRVASPSASADSPVANELILQAFRTNDPGNISTHLAFEDFKASIGNAVVSEKIPIALDSTDNLVRLVNEEQSRRLSVLANKILRLAGSTKR